MLLLLALACRTDKDVLDDTNLPGDTEPVVDLDGDDDGYDAQDQGGDDCDDANPDVNPGQVETPYNGTDDDCDEATLDDDLDGDGFIGDDDCDDEDPDVNPGQVETPYNGTDDDCDDSTAEDDLDGDGYGQDEDCDDEDPDVNPGAEEIWYDGVDQDCDEANDYDQDGDGDSALDQGGTDCDDTDPTRYGGLECRPETDADYAGDDTLNTDISGAFSDLVYDADGVLYLCTLISGQDYVYVYEDTTNTSTLNGYSNWNMNAIALDTNSANEVIVGYTTGASLGYEDAGTLPPLISGSAPSGGAYANAYMKSAPNSLAVDSSGCIWAANFAGAGTVSCVLSDGTKTDYTVGSAYIDAIALDSDETLHAVLGDTLVSFDPSTSTPTTVLTADAAILDLIFDYNDDIYLETANDELWQVDVSAGTTGVYDTVSGDGRLAIHPSGTLVRMVVNPTAAASFQDWAL